MQATIDHIVIWVADPLRSLDFYERVVGFDGVRAQEFRDGTAPFPSVRVSPHALIDLMARSSAPDVDASFRTPGASGHPVNHVCVALTRADFEALRSRVQADGGDTSATLEHSFGARGYAPHTFYFQDPDGNVIEARYYDEPQDSRPRTHRPFG